MKNFQSPAGLVQIKPVQVKYAAPMFHAIVMSKDNLSRFLDWAKEPSLQAQKDYLIQEKRRRFRKHPLSFAFVVNGQAVGAIDLRIQADEKLAEVGYWLTEEHQNLGIVTCGLEEIKQYAIDKLKLDGLYVNVLPANAASSRVAEKVGFIPDGAVGTFNRYTWRK
ncbi:GNAT family N-acetyltransferase [Fructobacillus sp. W13]|uniref:GNAT family N-acetyltransferase n=1 Tax=Fructobacillus apis TaxID=2935017 RepID=A0ABT0ZNU1_9LACO|nr:GNAT family N-acetyltransferase [Fructobacillus apis]MCO0831632.1 GNAT family N-acetyltransferase [Fructobacillus apis]